MNNKIMKIKELIQYNIGFFRFLVVGGLSTSLDMLIYFILFPQFGAIWSKMISMSFSILLSYNLNRYWSFKIERKRTIGEVLKYLATQLINITVNVSTNYIVLSLTGYKIVAFIIATATAMCINYLLQKVWVFRKK